MDDLILPTKTRILSQGADVRFTMAQPKFNTAQPSFLSQCVSRARLPLPSRDVSAPPCTCDCTSFHNWLGSLVTFQEVGDSSPVTTCQGTTQPANLFREGTHASCKCECVSQKPFSSEVL